MNESIKSILSEDIINEIEVAEKRNDGNEEAHWTLYVHVVHKELSGYGWDKYYVGITSHLSTRWRNNGMEYMNHGKEAKTYFANAIMKYGWDNIQHIVITNLLTKEEACHFEQLLIHHMNTTNRNYGYNRTTGGDAGRMFVNHVAQYDLTGQLIGTFINVSQASELTHTDAKSIHRVANGKQLQCKNSLWRYHDGDPLQQILVPNGVTFIPPFEGINQYDLLGNFVRHWTSIAEAAQEYGLNPTTISGVCNRYHKTAGGYQWRYYKDCDDIRDISQSPHLNHQVFVYTKEGGYVGCFDTKREAATKLNLKNKNLGFKPEEDDIDDNLHYNYRWTKKFYPSLPPLKKRKHNSAKPVAQLDLDGNVIALYYSGTEAVLAMGKANTGEISRCCSGARDRNVFCGYRWKYLIDIKESDITDSFLLSQYKEIMNTESPAKKCQ